jgi:predicted outer membrane protein
MDSAFQKTIGLAVITAVLTVFVARADGGSDANAAGTLAADSAALARDSAATPHWLSDGNLISLVAVMNQKQIAAADLELSGWRSDTVRALAAQLAQEHSALQRSADSLAASIKVTPTAGALTGDVIAIFQAQIDSALAGRGGPALDRAFVGQQVASHRLMSDYLDQFAQLAQRPEVRGWMEAAGARVDAQLARAKVVQGQLAAADSIVADSLARRAEARRNRQNQNR